MSFRRRIKRPFRRKDVKSTLIRPTTPHTAYVDATCLYARCKNDIFFEPCFRSALMDMCVCLCVLASAPERAVPRFIASAGLRPSADLYFHKPANKKRYVELIFSILHATLPEERNAQSALRRVSAQSGAPCSLAAVG